MAEVETSHWWYKCLHYAVLRSITKHFANKDITIIDACCGTGGLMLFLKDKGYDNVIGFDLSEIAVAVCKSRELNVFQGNLSEISNYCPHNLADVVICNDAYYFLNYEEQQTTAGDIHQILAKGGLLIANFPAFRAFSGIHDLSVGITSRFNKKKVRAIFGRLNFKFVAQMYWPFFLSPIIWVSRFKQRLMMRLRLLDGVEPKSDVGNVNPVISSILLLLCKTENKLLTNKPFGSSLFLVLKKY